MVGSIESIGEVVTGGITARVVEPHAGKLSGTARPV